MQVRVADVSDAAIAAHTTTQHEGSLQIVEDEFDDNERERKHTHSKKLTLPYSNLRPR